MVHASKVKNMTWKYTIFDHEKCKIETIALWWWKWNSFDRKRFNHQAGFQIDDAPEIWLADEIIGLVDRNRKNSFENLISDSDLFAKERQKLEKSENRKSDKTDCDVIESLKILNKSDGQMNFFPIIQKILLSSEFQSFDIRKTALPGTICISTRVIVYDS